MNQILSALCAIIAVVVVVSAAVYACCRVVIVTFGNSESGQAVQLFLLCSIAFMGLMAMFTRINAR